MALETTYTITGKKTGSIVFKFDINGSLIFFSYEGEQLDEKKRQWLYPRIPISEDKMSLWKGIKEFTVAKGDPDISFDAFYTPFGNKVKRAVSEKLFNKLSKADKINLILCVKPYLKWLSHQRGQAQQQPDTFIRQQRWLDDFTIR